MPRSISQAVRSAGASTQAIVRSEQPRPKGFTTNSHRSARKATKGRGSYLPKPKILRIQQRYIAGENKSEIARNENCDRETVARIVKFPEVQNFIAQQQQEFFGLIPDAMAAVRYALQVERDPHVAYRVLEATGVAPHPGERLEAPAATAEDREEHQAHGLAAVILETHRNFGFELPDEMKKAVEKADRREARFPRR